MNRDTWFRWASPTRAHGMPTPEDLEAQGWERSAVDGRHGSVLMKWTGPGEPPPEDVPGAHVRAGGA